MKCDSCGRQEGVRKVKRGQMGILNLCAICRDDKRSKANAEHKRKIKLGIKP